MASSKIDSKKTKKLKSVEEPVQQSPKKTKSKSSDSSKSNNDKKSGQHATLFPTPVAVDATLASLFSTSSGPVKPTSSARAIIPIPRKQDKFIAQAEADSEDETEEEEEDESEVPLNALAASEESLKQERKRKRKRNNDGELEDAYMEKLLDEPSKATSKKQKKTEEPIEEETVESEEDDEAEAEDVSMVDAPKEEGEEVEPVDDSDSDDDDAESSEDKPTERIRHETEGELQNKDLDKANRTVFVGNLPSTVISEKAHLKTLKRAFKDHGVIESIRFRSIAFSDQIPRKAAFITKALHVEQTTINAYIVMKTTESARSSLKLNGTEILGRHIRVDSVAHPAKNDSRKCVFVGNLDFEASEESLWKHFSACGKVDNVRLIRDPKTNVGKGIAYVQFEDEIHVDQALLLDGKPMIGDKRKRKLRIARAKNMKRKAVPASNSGLRTVKTKTGVYVPKADPRKNGMVGRAGKLFGRAGGAKVKRTSENTTFEGTRAVPGMDTGLRFGGAGKKKGKGRDRKTSRSTAWKQKPKSS